MAKSKPVIRKQVAALPVRRGPEGELRVLLITSRETGRFIIPKGWPMKRRKDHRAAAIEAMQEGGVVGRVHRKPIGSYIYWKRLPERFELCKVEVFVLEASAHLPVWREKGQRRVAWLRLEDAADLVDDPGLVPLIRKLPRLMSKRRRAKGGKGIKLPPSAIEDVSGTAA